MYFRIYIFCHEQKPQQHQNMDFNMKKFPNKYLSQKELACQRIKKFQPWPLNSASSTSLLNMFQQFLFCLVSDLFRSVFFYFDLRVLFSFHFFLGFFWFLSFIRSQ